MQSFFRIRYIASGLPSRHTNVIANTDNMLLKEDLQKEKNSLLNKLRKLQYHQKHEQRAERRQKQ